MHSLQLTLANAFKTVTKWMLAQLRIGEHFALHFLHTLILCLNVKSTDCYVGQAYALSLILKH